MKTKCYHNINITLNARITETYLHLELVQDLNSEHKIKPRINPWLNSEHKIKPRINPWRSFNISRPTSMIIQTQRTESSAPFTSMIIHTENRIKCTFSLATSPVMSTTTFFSGFRGVNLLLGWVFAGIGFWLSGFSETSEIGSSSAFSCDWISANFSLMVWYICRSCS